MLSETETFCAKINGLHLLRLSVTQRTTDQCVFRYRQTNVRRLLTASDHWRPLFRCLNCAQRFDYHVLGSSRKLGGVAKYLIDSSEKRICRLSFEFYGSHVIERRSNSILMNCTYCKLYQCKCKLYGHARTKAPSPSHRCILHSKQPFLS